MVERYLLHRKKLMVSWWVRKISFTRKITIVYEYYLIEREKKK